MKPLEDRPLGRANSPLLVPDFRPFRCLRLGRYLVLPLLFMLFASGAAQACQRAVGSTFADQGQACALEGSAADDPNLLALPGTLTRSGNPVDIVSGRKSLRRLHLQASLQGSDLFGQGLPLTWAVFYDSGEPQLESSPDTKQAREHPAGDLGVAWRHGFELRLTSQQSGEGKTANNPSLIVNIHQADGVVHRFRYRPERGVFAADQAELGEIQTFDAGPSRHWIWRQVGGRQAHFDAAGRLSGWRSPLGQRLDLHYSKTGRLIEIAQSARDHAGSLRKRASLHLQWDAHQVLIEQVELKQERDNAAATMLAQCSYRYDRQALNNPLLVGVACKQTQQAVQDWREQYFYEDARFRQALTRVRLERSKEPALEAHYAYDAWRRVLKSQGIGEGTAQALRIEYSDPSSKEAPWRQLSRAGQSMAYRFEALPGPGEQASQDSPYGRWRRQSDTPCAWCPDASANHESVRDQRGRIVELRDPKSKRWLERRRYASEDATELPAEVLRPSVRDGAFATSRFERNTSGLVLAIEHQGFSPSGRTGNFALIQRRIRFRYASDGRGIDGVSLDDGSGETLAPDHIALPWVIPGRQLQGLAWQGTARYSDDFGRVVLIRHPQGASSQARYDARDRLIEQQSPDGKRMSLRWDALSYPLEKDYGESGRSVFQWANAVDRRPLLRAAQREPASQDGLKVAIQWAYDEKGRVIERRQQVGKHRFNWAIGRDHQGRVVNEQLPDGGTLNYRYDARGLVSISYQHGFGALSQMLYQRLDDNALAYRLGHFVVRWEQAPDDSGELRQLEVEGLAKWALRPRANHPLASGDSASTGDPGFRARMRALPGQAPVIAGGFRYDGAQAWLGDQKTTMHYDPLGQPAMLAVQDRPGQVMVMDGWRQLLLADENKGLQALVVWLGALPIAWIESGRVYHLAVDWRGAPVLAFDATGEIHWKANYLHPLRPDIEHRGASRKIAGRSLSDRILKNRLKINLGVPGRLFASETLAQADARLQTLLFGANRVLDTESMRFLQADPLGPAGDRDAYLYAEGEPWRYVDPWGLAKLTYVALLQGERGKSTSSTQGFSIGRWSFLLEAIAPTHTAPGSSASGWQGLQNEYAKTQQALLFDAQGSFRHSQQDPLLGSWFGEDSLRFQADQRSEVMAGFNTHYAGALISQSAFVIDNFDDGQATRLMALLSRDQKARRSCLQPSSPLLPTIKFNDGSADLRPDAPQAQGASVQRLLECEKAPSGIPEPLYLGLYADSQEQARVERLLAAAQLQEAPSPSSITPDCTKDGCRSKAAIAINGREYFASYGSTQFVLETFLRTLRQDVLFAKDLDPRTLSWLGLDQSISDAAGQARSMAWWINQGIARAQSAAQAFDSLRARYGKGLSPQAALAHWNQMTGAQQIQWQTSSGLDRDAFVDILGFLPDGRARTEAEARNAFAAHAVFRLGHQQKTTGQGSGFADWLKALFADQARFGLISRLLLRQHLRTILSEPALQARVSNLEPPGSKAHGERQQAIEQDIAYRVALMHNGGKQASGALDPNRKPPAYLQSYAEEFLRMAGRGNWEALRCGQSLGVAGLQMQTLRLG